MLTRITTAVIVLLTIAAAVFGGVTSYFDPRIAHGAPLVAGIIVGISFGFMVGAGLLAISLILGLIPVSPYDTRWGRKGNNSDTRY